MMDRTIAILGPLTLTVSRVPVDRVQSRVRTVLAVLAARSGRPVTRDDLIGALWGGELPQRPEQQLAVALSTARRVLGLSRAELTFRAGAYTLSPAAATIDLRAFTENRDRARDLAARGQESTALATYEKALELWRGEPFSDVRDHGILDSERLHLQGTYRMMVEERLALAVKLGHHRRIQLDLAAALRADPFNESLAALAMQTEHGQGRTAEALTTFDRLAAALKEELGARPGPHLLALRERIARHEPLPHAEADHEAIPLGLASDLTAGLRSLSGEQAALLDLMATAGFDTYPAWTAGAMLGVEHDRGKRILRELQHNYLLEGVHARDVPQRYRLHPLVYRAKHNSEPRTSTAQHAALRRLLSGWLTLTEAATRRDAGGVTGLHGQAARYPLPQQVINVELASGGWAWTEWPNLIRAVDLAAGLGEVDLCWELATTIFGLQVTHGYFDDVQHIYHVALAAAITAGDHHGEAMLRLGWGALAVGRDMSGAPDLERARELFTGLSEPRGVAYALRFLAFTARLHGDHSAALALGHAALAALAEHPVAQIEFFIHVELARINAASGLLNDAQQAIEAAGRLVEDLGGHGHRAHHLTCQAEIALARGLTDDAASQFRQALAEARHAGALFLEAHILGGLGQAQAALGHTKQALETLIAGRDAARSAGRHRTEAGLTASIHSLTMAQRPS